jgi:predicted transcriptional regulator
MDARTKALGFLAGAGAWCPTKEVAVAMGLTPVAARKVLRKLVAEGRVEARKGKRYDHQHNRHGLFGGTGMMVRRFWEYRLTWKEV